MVALIVILVVIAVGSAIFFILKNKGGTSKNGGGKSQTQIIREAKRKLDRNPDDPDGLSELGDIYFQNKLEDP